MEQSLQTQDNNKSVSTLTYKDYIKQLVHVNCLVNPSFPIPDRMIEIWAESIVKLRPEITPYILEKIIDKMKTGEIKYDSRKGIQNIFSGYIEILKLKVQYLTEIIKNIENEEERFLKKEERNKFSREVFKLHKENNANSGGYDPLQGTLN